MIAIVPVDEGTESCSCTVCPERIALLRSVYGCCPDDCLVLSWEAALKPFERLEHGTVAVDHALTFGAEVAVNPSPGSGDHLLLFCLAAAVETVSALDAACIASRHWST